jgi:GT2 family glycosyltransferase
MDISVLIVNYNTAELVKKCIESLLDQQNVNFEIIVIDNNSHDSSAEILQKLTPRITFILNTDNKGFGRANNQAFKLCKGRYIFMLNPDAVCLTNQDLAHAVQFMNAHPECGLAGTRIVNGNQQLEETSFYHYPRQKQTSANFSGLPGKLATVLGASMIVRREVFEKVNGFDEEFFLYGEETDLCLRIRKAGYMIGYCEFVTVQHIGSASEKGNPPEEIIRKKKLGKLLFYRKHYPEADVRKLVKQDLNRAYLHLFRLTLIKWLFGLNNKQQAQYRRHLIVRDLTRNYL